MSIRNHKRRGQSAERYGIIESAHVARTLQSAPRGQSKPHPRNADAFRQNCGFAIEVCSVL